MAYVSFDSLNVASTPSTQTPKSQVGFFTLKNDGDEAIVRFMHDDTNSFEILSTHSIQLNGKYRRVNCVRGPKDALSVCPLCEKGENTEYRFYIHLLQYVNNPDGTVSVEPKIWERSVSYANKLREYINNYGPMSDVICKIVRHGRAGDMKTEYEIIPNLSKQVYRDDVFVKKEGLFEGYKTLGRAVLEKNAAEIREYLNTGNFPAPTTTTPTPQTTTAPNWSAPADNDIPQWNVRKEEPKTSPWENTQTPPWATTSSIQRPTRF